MGRATTRLYRGSSDFTDNPGLCARPNDWKNLLISIRPSLGPRGGPIIRDNSTYRRHATMTVLDNADWVVDGERRHQLRYDGAAGHVLDTSDAMAEYHSSSVTWCCWVKYESTTNLDHSWSFSGNRSVFWFRTGPIRFSWINSVSGGDNEVTGTTSVLTGVWYWCCGTWDGTNTRLYVNGVNEASLTSSGDTDDTGTLRFGLGPSSRYLDGYIDDIRFYNRVMGPAEILSLYKDTDGMFRLRKHMFGFSSVAAVTDSWAARTGRRTQMGRGIGRGR